MILKINKDNPDERLIKMVAETLKDDGVILYPTDTIYGIGCSIFNKGGIERIYQIKQRDKKKPMSFICQSLSEASKYVRLTDFAYRIMKDALPGPFTFVLEATSIVPNILQTKRKTVGIRIPDSKICMAILREFGEPITSTSANISEQPELEDVYDIKNTFDKRIDLYIDAGVLTSEPSTVISLLNDEFTILRQGKGELKI